MFVTKASTRPRFSTRSEEHTSELQSQSNLVCRLLLEKKKSTRDRNSILLSTSQRDSSYCTIFMSYQSRKRSSRGSLRASACTTGGRSPASKCSIHILRLP